ncbi:RCC1 domain-containing protein [Pyxidicoccus sp. 3LG]
MKKLSRRPVLSRGLLGALLALQAAPWVGCSEPTPSQPPPVVEESQTAEALFSIRLEEDAGKQKQGQVSAQAIRAQDVSRILVDVYEQGQSSTPLFINFELTKAEEALEWSGSIPFLPRGKMLTFFARAYEAGDASNPIFSGHTDQTLTGNRQDVTIHLRPRTDGEQIQLPRITRISIPSQFISGQSGNVSFSVEGTTGETLSYGITRSTEPSSGLFFPSEGSITPLARAGTFVSQYSPDAVTAVTDYVHSVRVTNPKGHSVSSTFTTKVRPPSTTDGVVDTRVQVLFNPVIAGLEARRLENSGNVVFTATIEDDDATHTYAWSFTPEGSFEPAPALTFTDNVAILANYTTAVQGILSLSVTDPDGGQTTLTYLLTPNQFPDDLIVNGPLSGMNSLRAGGSHTCVLFNDGNMRCWGQGTYGQLGYGESNDLGDDESLSTLGNLTLVGRATRITAGGTHTCALLEGGLVRCWVRNQFGQLGYNSTLDVGDGEPIASFGYVNLGGNAVKLAAGLEHTCALLDTGRVRCWGRNQHGQLGYGNIESIGDNEQPWKAGDVNLGGLAAKDIVAGDFHTCALLTDGRMSCWGHNAHGQLGLSHRSNLGDVAAPNSVAPYFPGGPAMQLSAGKYHTCALLETGAVRCWGGNLVGQTGVGSGGTSYFICTDYNGGNEACYYRLQTDPATTTLNLGARALQMASGGYHNCALLSTGAVKCWGHNQFGQLGINSTQTQYTPPGANVDLGGSTAYQLTVGGMHSCALLSTGKARCWGQGTYGQLGYGNEHHIGDNEVASTAGDIPLATSTTAAP